MTDMSDVAHTNDGPEITLKLTQPQAHLLYRLAVLDSLPDTPCLLPEAHERHADASREAANILADALMGARLRDTP
jgi:hypothetical protein